MPGADRLSKRGRGVSDRPPDDFVGFHQTHTSAHGRQVATAAVDRSRYPVSDSVIRFALSLSRLSRHNHPQAPDFVKKYVTWGAGPRASQHLIHAAKARAAIQGRLHADESDVRAVAAPVLRHRIVTNFHAEADKQTADGIIAQLIDLASRSSQSPSLAERVSGVFTRS